MTTLKPYPAYKDSGVDWLGDVPKHWETRAAKRMLREVSDKGCPSLPLLAATQSMGVVRKDRYGQRTVLAMSNLESLKRVQVDDYVISLRSFQGGIERAYDEGILSSAYTVLRRNPKLLDAGYLARVFKSKPFLGELELNVTGIREGQNINYGSLRESHLPLPPLDEQRAIADFLDGMDARITRFIAARRKMIALLEEQKQAVINQAVTRGLDPDVPLKDSGVDWLGETPVHWAIPQIGHFSRVGNGSTPSRSNYGYWTSEGFPWLNSGCVHAGLVTGSDQYVTTLALIECHLPVVEPGDLLVAITGQGKTRGTAALVGLSATINQHMAYIKISSPKVIPTYLHKVLKAAYQSLRELSSDSGSTKGALTCADIRHFRVPIPPLAEQEAISAHIDHETSRIDMLISRHRREIELMQEYRTRLISDVVTGKRDVRGVELPPVEAVFGEEIETALDEQDEETPLTV